jgi:hypothetical protein
MGDSILIFTPTWIDPATQETAIRPECEAAIKAQVLRDGEFDWHVTWDNPYPIGDHRNVLHQYQQAREWFLKGSDCEGRPYDALLTIEHDNVLPDPDAVQRLLDTPGDVIYAPYLLRHGRPMLSTWQYVNNRSLGMSLTQHPRELRQARKNIVWRVCGCGMGCTLFRRPIVEAIPFEHSSPRNPCPDLGFATRALQAGFTSYGRFDVPVWHYTNGGWLHPFKEVKMLKYLARTTVRVSSCGRIIQLTAGKEVELSDEEAADVGRCGFIEAMPEPGVPAQAPLPMGEVESAPPAAEVEIVPPSKRRAKTIKKSE